MVELVVQGMKPEDINTADHTAVIKAEEVCPKCYLSCMLLHRTNNDDDDDDDEDVDEDKDDNNSSDQDDEDDEPEAATDALDGSESDTDQGV